MFAEKFTLGLLSCLMLYPSHPKSQAVEVWLTQANQEKLFSHETPIPLFNGETKKAVEIVVDTMTRYQQIEGFGAALTGSSAYVINRHLHSEARAKLLKELFDHENGIGLSYLRLSIGSSDFSLGLYSYDDVPIGKTDFELEHFSIAQERTDLIPVLKEIYSVNPQISLMASPWSAPAWMKDSQKMEGGRLRKKAFPAYAKYFTKYIQEFAAEGIPINAITIQNEPQHEALYPSMAMSADEQSEFIANHLGPLFAQAQIKTQILLFDHNWDSPQYPISILDNPQAKKYVTGSAFHCYEGEVSAMSKVQEAHPEMGLYFTECSSGLWYADFAENFLDVSKLLVTTTNNWSKNVLMWNLALDEKYGPTTNPADSNGGNGCMECLGLIAIHSQTGQVTRNADYYAFAHFAKFVRPGAYRVASTQLADKEILNVAFVNSDGTRVLVVFNNSNMEKTFTIKESGKSFLYSLPPQAMATLNWE